jgi:predicted protein tyrosine phosphatase
MRERQDKPVHMFGSMNQIATLYNRYQMEFTKVLFACSAGILRSPTASHIFAQEPYNWNTRAAGCESSFALVPVTLPLIMWADYVYLMEDYHLVQLERIFGDELTPYKDKIVVLDIPDNYPYMDTELVKLLKEKVEAHQQSLTESTNVVA